MPRTPPRDITPVTGPAWRRLGFYHEFDPNERVWRLCGSRAGLLGLARLLARHADAAGPEEHRPLPLGPYGDLQVRFWDRPGIDDDSIYGPPGDLRRLARLIEAGLAGTAPGGDLEIGTEYAHDAECALVFEIMDDDFDPAEAVVLDDAVPAPVASAPQLGFKFHDTESEGVVRVEGGDLVIQYERKDFAAIVTRITDAFVGGARSNIEDLVIPLSEVTGVRFKRGVFWADLAVQVRDLKQIERVPAVRAGALRLRFRRADRDDAADLARAIEDLLA